MYFKQRKKTEFTYQMDSNPREVLQQKTIYGNEGGERFGGKSLVKILLVYILH